MKLIQEFLGAIKRCAWTLPSLCVAAVVSVVLSFILFRDYAAGDIAATAAVPLLTLFAVSRAVVFLFGYLDEPESESGGRRPPVLFTIFGFAFVIFAFLGVSTLMAMGVYLWLGLSQPADLALAATLFCAPATLIGFIGMVFTTFGEFFPAIWGPIVRRVLGIILGLPSLATYWGRALMVPLLMR